MAVIVVGLLILAMAGHSSAAFCVCKQGMNSAILQKAIDYACGAGADCRPINPNGPCYNPNNIVNHCSYAVNSYYQRKAASGATCDFGGVAILTGSDPSGGGCSFSATSGSVGTGTTGPITTVPTTSPTTGTTPTSTPVTPVSGTGGTGGVGVTPTTGSTTSPYTSSPTAGTPSAGMIGGVGTGLAPTGSMDDPNHGGLKLERTSMSAVLSGLVISMFLWN